MPLSFLPAHLRAKAKKKPVAIKIVISEDTEASDTGAHVGAATRQD